MSLIYKVNTSPKDLLKALRTQVNAYKTMIQTQHVGEEGKHRLFRVEATLDSLEESVVTSEGIVLVMMDLLVFDNLNSRLCQRLNAELRSLLECQYDLFTTSPTKQLHHFQQQDEKLGLILNNFRKNLPSDIKLQLFRLNSAGITKGLRNYAEDLKARNEIEGKRLMDVAEELDALDDKTADNYRNTLKKYSGKKLQSTSSVSVFEKIISYLCHALANVLSIPITKLSENKNIHQIFYRKEVTKELERLEPLTSVLIT